jgi:hypothetical protein
VDRHGSAIKKRMTRPERIGKYHGLRCRGLAIPHFDLRAIFQYSPANCTFLQPSSYHEFPWQGIKLVLRGNQIDRKAITQHDTKPVRSTGTELLPVASLCFSFVQPRSIAKARHHFPPERRRLLPTTSVTSNHGIPASGELSSSSPSPSPEPSNVAAKPLLSAIATNSVKLKGLTVSSAPIQ